MSSWSAWWRAGASNWGDHTGLPNRVGKPLQHYTRLPNRVGNHYNITPDYQIGWATITTLRDGIFNSVWFNNWWLETDEKYYELGGRPITTFYASPPFSLTRLWSDLTTLVSSEWPPPTQIWQLCWQGSDALYLLGSGPPHHRHHQNLHHHNHGYEVISINNTHRHSQSSQPPSLHDHDCGMWNAAPHISQRHQKMPKNKTSAAH